MADPFLGEIRAVGFTFAPRGWVVCDGRLLSIAQYSAVFAILGTQYGGNGQTNFAVPDLRGNVMVSQGQGTGLSDYVVGEQTGTPNVTLIITEIPNHNHSAAAQTEVGFADQHGTPVAGDQLSRFAPNPGVGLAFVPPPNGAPVLFNAQMLGIAGGSQPHSNTQPYLALLYCIALEGIFPSRN
jgi:microcystin-dependent protein